MAGDPKDRPSSRQGRKATYKRLFIEALAQRSVDKNSPVSEWVYAGGDTGPHAGWYKLRFPGRAPPQHQGYCACTHEITENCYIENKLTHELLVVGNCCIRHYLPKDQTGRTCPECGKPHKNRKDPWCAACRGGVLKVGKYSGKSFRSVLEEDEGYCHWVRREARTGNLADFSDWLAGVMSESEGDEDNAKGNEEAGEEILRVGKHRGETFEYVRANDEDYCYWVLGEEIAKGPLFAFSEWLKSRQ